MIRRPVATLVIAVVLVATALLAVARLRIDTSLTSLFDADDPSARALVRVLDHFKTVEELLVLVQTPPDQPPEPRQLQTFAERLQAAVTGDPVAGDLSEGVIWKVDEQTRKFFEEVVVPNGLFYLDDTSLEAAMKRLTRDQIVAQIRRNETLISTPGPGASALAKVILQDPLRLHEFLLDRIAQSQPFKTYQNSDAFFAPDGRSLLIRVRGRRPVSDLDFARQFTAVIGALADRVNTDGLRVDFSGGYAIAAASERAIRSDMISNVIWGVVTLQLLFILAYRRPIQSFLLAFLPVAAGVVYGFGAYALMADALTPMTAVIGGLLAAMSIDYAVEFLSHYHARRAAGDAAEQASRRSRRDVALVMTAAWATTIVGFLAIATSHVKALRDFSLLGSLALTGAFLAGLLVLPPLLALADRRDASTTPRERLPVRRALHWLTRYPRTSIALVLALFAAALIVLVLPGKLLPLESDLTVMHPRPNPPLETQDRITRTFGTSPGTMLVHLAADDDTRLVQLAHEVDGGLRRADGVVGTFGLATLLPDPAVAPKRVAQAGPEMAERVVADFRAALADSLFDPQKYEPYVDFLRKLLTTTRPPGMPDLRRYPTLAQTIMPASADANESLTLVFLRDPGDRRDVRDAAIASIRSSLSGLSGATLTGMGVLNHDTELAVRRELPRLMIISVAACGIYLVLYYRNLLDCILAMLPTVLGIVCLLAFMRLSGQKLNMINLVAFPLLIGIDVDYGIFLVSAARSARRKGAASIEEILAELTPAASAVVMCATTTTIGFLTLITTSIPAVRSLGAAVTVGVTSCVAAAFLLLVPVLVLLNRRRRA